MLAIAGQTYMGADVSRSSTPHSLRSENTRDSTTPTPLSRSVRRTGQESVARTRGSPTTRSPRLGSQLSEGDEEAEGDEESGMILYRLPVLASPENSTLISYSDCFINSSLRYTIAWCSVLLVFLFAIITALQSGYTPASYSCHASNFCQQLSPYGHHLDLNLTAHTDYLTALDQASTLSTLGRHQSSAQSSLNHLTSYLVSNLSCTFREHDASRVGDTSTAIWTAVSFATDVLFNMSTFQSIYDDIIP